jgi:hypothetical protein
MDEQEEEERITMVQEDEASHIQEESYSKSTESLEDSSQQPPLEDSVPLEDISQQSPLEDNVPLEVSSQQQQSPLEDESNSVPQLVFIVPYRDRTQHHAEHSVKLPLYLKNHNILSYKILYIHQTDTRGFNRGAMKNIGFITVKNMYPNDYKDIVLVFNDIDTIPAETAQIDFSTVAGKIKHFYGFTFTLGGLFSILASDFERLNGFPNFWAWGYEDNLIQIRAEEAGIQIDRTTFYKIGDPNIVRLEESSKRQVNISEFNRFESRTKEGINTISGLISKINDQTGFVDVVAFNTQTEEQLIHRTEYDVRNGPVPFKVLLPNRRGRGTPNFLMKFF